MTVRTVSLLPSATEIVVAVGGGAGLIGRSHECDFPDWVEALPVLTSTKLRKGLESLEIERQVQDLIGQGLSVYAVDAPQLRDLRPDVIVTQTQCAVCAVTPRDLEAALAAWQGAPPLLLSLAPETLADVWDDMRRVGTALGTSAQAEQAVAALQQRLVAIAGASPERSPRPSVAAIEWIDPLMAAGNWVPELIAIAGGRPLFAASGQHSPWLDWQTLAAADPDIIVVMPCGFQIAQSLSQLAPLRGHALWPTLSAVRNDRVFIGDGHHFFNRPGPRLVESAEILAAIIRDDAAAGSGWVRLNREFAG